MHKSIQRRVFTFRLLASSLVMLAVMPFLNQQQNSLFSNPVPMAQEYDDNYGDSSYSTYPTDDKKYECRTGLFEGFFVSSVEFCDLFYPSSQWITAYGPMDQKVLDLFGWLSYPIREFKKLSSLS